MIVIEIFCLIFTFVDVSKRLFLVIYMYSLLPLKILIPSFMISAKASAFNEKFPAKFASLNCQWLRWRSMSNGAEVEPSCVPCVKGEAFAWAILQQSNEVKGEAFTWAVVRLLNGNVHHV